MSETPQTQTPEGVPQEEKSVFQINLLTSKPVKQPIRVKKEIYNLLRSFTESSNKEKYTWNIGYDLGDTVIFRKEGKWTLEIKKVVNNLDEAVMLYSQKTTIRFGITDYQNFIMFIDDKMIKEEDEEVILPAEEVPYATPIFTSEIFQKLREFVSISINYNGEEKNG